MGRKSNSIPAETRTGWKRKTIGTSKNSLKNKEGITEGELLQIKDGGSSHSFESPVTRQYREALSELLLRDRHVLILQQRSFLRYFILHSLWERS